MKEQTLSKAAIAAKRHYYNVERWENKAKKTYGKNYIPAREGEVISLQAVELRRKYQREYRKTHPEMYKRATAAFWERRGKENKFAT